MRTIARPPSLRAPLFRAQAHRVSTLLSGSGFHADAGSGDAETGPPVDAHWRVCVAGAELTMVVLAPTIDGCVGIDLDSGAFVRAVHPPGEPALRALDIVAGQLAGPPDPPDDARPEAVDLVSAPRRVGRLGRRRLGRYYEALTHPDQGPLLGFAGPSIPYWTLTGDRPSLALVAAEVGPQLRWTGDGFQCRFAWQGLVHELPLADPRLVAGMKRQRRSTCAGRDLARLAGFRPGPLLVLLTPPVAGYCHKQVAALLPAR